MAKDLVCGMLVDETGDVVRSVVDGTTYFFCTPRCRARFEEAPHRYLNAALGGGADAAPEASECAGEQR